MCIRSEKESVFLAVFSEWVHFKLPKWVKSTLALTDIDQYGIPVLVLSALRYPHSDEAQKYELSTLIRALLVLSKHIGALDVAESDPPPLPYELFIDDPAIPRGSPEGQKEVQDVRQRPGAAL